MLTVHTTLDWVRIVWRLKRQGFRREGRRIVTPGAVEMILPDFVRGRIRLCADYDEAWGYTLLSDSTAADDFLTTFAQEFIKPLPRARSSACS